MTHSRMVIRNFSTTNADLLYVVHTLTLNEAVCGFSYALWYEQRNQHAGDECHR